MTNRLQWLGAVLLFSLHTVASAASLSGNWITVDDKTGKQRSVIEISQTGNQYVGRVKQKLQHQPGDTGICEKCPANFRGKPILGLQILWGLKQTGANRFEGGHILDPKSGSVYSCKIDLAEDGRRLQIRGFIGISLLGRTQTWYRQN